MLGKKHKGVNPLPWPQRTSALTSALTVVVKFMTATPCGCKAGRELAAQAAYMHA